MNHFRLAQMEKDGSVPGAANLPADLQEHLRQSVGWFEKVGFRPPWVGYVAVDGDVAVGICAFKTAPKNGSVEIAYGTREEFQNRGYATAMARRLVQLAREAAPEILVTAQTLREKNASTRALEKAGFMRIGEAMDDEVGVVWEWQFGG
jgi:[ribosomal protein S5]-alanine N-acetyltransferase